MAMALSRDNTQHSMEDRLDSPHVAKTMAGRACVSCVRAKAKCAWTGAGISVCDRCSRLGRPCQPSPAVRKRASNKEPKTAAKVARLEEKLDSLVSLIKAHPQATLPATLHSSASPHDGPSPETLLPTPSATTPNTVDTISSLGSLQAHDFSTPVSQPVFGKDLPASEANSAWPHFHSGSLSMEAAEEALSTFRNQMLRHLPILAIPTNLHSLELKAQRPFLWLCIMAVSLKCSTQQRALGMEVRRTMAYRIILEGERNLDLLHGLLVYAGWSQHYVFSKPIITNVVQLAIALLADLGLNKFALKDPFGLLSECDNRGCPRPIVNSAPRTIEERRTALACFCCSNFISIHWQRAEPLAWNPYFEECLQLLMDSNEGPGDQHLAYLIRLQLILVKVSGAPWLNDDPRQADAVKAPASSYVEALSRELTTFKRGLPSDMEAKETLVMYAHRATLIIHEVALQSYPLTPGNSDLQRLDYLWTCLQAVKSWFELFLQIPPSAYVGLPMFVFSSLAHSSTALGKLSTIELPGWDLRLVRETCYLPTVLEQAIRNLQQVKTAVGLDPETPEDISMFANAARKCAAIKHWNEIRLANSEASHQETPSVNDLSNETLLDMVDDTWLRDYFGIDEMRTDKA